MSGNTGFQVCLIKTFFLLLFSVLLYYDYKENIILMKQKEPRIPSCSPLGVVCSQKNVS